MVMLFRYSCNGTETLDLDLRLYSSRCKRTAMLVMGFMPIVHPDSSLRTCKLERCVTARMRYAAITLAFYDKMISQIVTELTISKFSQHSCQRT